MKTTIERETMKTYIGTKIIQAEPRTKNYGPIEQQDQPGYTVVYPDGYTSWSPSEAFEDAYVDIGDVTGLVPHQVRVVAEKAALDKKSTDLINFIDTNPIFEKLDPSEQERLKLQHHFMSHYSVVLGERIAAFGVKV